MTLMEALKAGAVFHYAPVSGGLLLMLKGERLEVPYSMQDFVTMQWDGTLEKFGDMGQGHNLLRGKVDYYRLKK